MSVPGDSIRIQWKPETEAERDARLATYCQTYWGSHGCHLGIGHAGLCECDCCECEDHEANPYDEDGIHCVAKAPYYGPETRFYGDGAKRLGLPTKD